MKLSKVLNSAADGIEAFGHYKGGGYGPGLVETAPACTIGAIHRAARWHIDVGRDATSAVEDYLGHKSPGVVGWNDAPERTAEQVVEALRAAAVIEAAKESAPELTPAAVLVGSGA